jgi:hypothetical protein
MHDTRRIGRSNNSSTRPPELLVERNLDWELNAMQFSADGRSILAAYGDSSGGGVRLMGVCCLSLDACDLHLQYIPDRS